jgi:hypothetical protein
LPPFALLHARELYRKIRAQMPNVKIIIGMWKFAGDPIKAATRLHIDGNDKLALTLAQTILQADVFRGIEMVPEDVAAGTTK